MEPSSGAPAPPLAAPPPSAPGPSPVTPPDGSPAGGSPSEASVPAGPSGSARLERGQGRSPRDMALSLVVLLVPIALLMLFYRLVLGGDSPVTVDPAPTIQEARQANAFPVVAPQGLGDDWHASKATFTRRPEGVTLRIGYVDPDDDPVQLVESSVPAATLLPAELTGAAKQLGSFRAPTGVWRLYDTRPGEKALVLSDGTRTVIVVGRTAEQNLKTLAASLR